jgi:hypothetical protein
MKYRTLILTTAIAILTASQAQALDATIKGPNRYGCISEAYYKKTNDMVTQNDKEAFVKLLGAGIDSGICVMFKAGEPVVITQNGIFSVVIRRRGDVTEYWADADAISR